MSEDAPFTLQEIVSGTEAETQQRRESGQLPSDLIRQLARPLDDPPEDAPEALAHIPSGRPLQVQGLLGPAVVAVKRVTRRLLSWYVSPIAADQSRFNEATVTLLRRLERRVERLEAPWAATPASTERQRALTTARKRLLADLERLPGTVVLVLGDTAGLAATGDAAVLVVRGDPIACLERLNTATLGGIVLAGVVPQLSTADLLSILPMAADRLLPGGWLVADARDLTRPDDSADDVRLQRRIDPVSLTQLFDAAGLGGGEPRALGADPVITGWFAVAGRRT